jgi:hypothetical protein
LRSLFERPSSTLVRSSYPHARTATVDPALSGTAGQISGRVTSAATNGGIEGIGVCAYDESEEFLEEEEEGFGAYCGTVGAGGNYVIAGLPAGEYIVEFFSTPDSELDYITQFYNEQATFFEAEPISVDAGGTHAGVDARLHLGGEIKGTVTSATSKQPVDGIEVCH